jgi:hypothetical protein
MSSVAAQSVEPALIADLPGIVACDDLAQSDPNRLRSLEAWVKRGECFVASFRWFVSKGHIAAKV